MRRRSATDRTRRPARSHRRQTNGSGALRRTPPPSPSPLDPPTPRHPPPLRNSQGGGGTLGGELRPVRPSLALRATCPDPLRDIVLRRGQHVNTTPRGLRTYRQTWLAQTTNARPPDMPGFTPEPPGSQPSFALQQKPQSERPLLRGSTPSTYKFNNNYTPTSTSNSNTQQQHPTATPRYARARWVPVVPAMRKSALWPPIWARPSAWRRKRAARSGALRVACAACPVLLSALGFRAERALLHPPVVRFAIPPAQPREETEDKNDSLPPLRFPSAPRGAPHPPPKDKTMNPVWYRARASASLRHQPVLSAQS